MEELNFLYKKKILKRLKYTIIFVLVHPIFTSKQTFEDSIDLLLLIKNDKSHYVYIQDFNTFMFHKTKIKIKNGFLKVVCSFLVVKMC